MTLPSPGHGTKGRSPLFYLRLEYIAILVSCIRWKLYVEKQEDKKEGSAFAENRYDVSVYLYMTHIRCMCVIFIILLCG